jgi:hypothetical protein
VGIKVGDVVTPVIRDHWTLLEKDAARQFTAKVLNFHDGYWSAQALTSDGYIYISAGMLFNITDSSFWIILSNEDEEEII